MKTSATIKGLVLKVASRCNLNCEYCYMYNLGDESYKNQPKFMSQEVVDNLLNQVKIYLTQSGSKTFQFIFHGGEPLLVEPNFYQTFVRKTNEILPTSIQIGYLIQTNGTLLSPEWCKILGDLQFKIGISLDGITEEGNRYRLNHRGESSLATSLIGLQNAQRSRYLKYIPGLLSVINLELNPEELYWGYKDLKIRHINFLLPDGTHDNLPKGYSNTQALYADWLIKIFDIWFYDKDKSKPQIRFFNQILNRILGGNGDFESLGGGRNPYLVIETNGDIEPQSSLKACGDGFTKTQLNVKTHSLKDSFQQPLIKLCIDSQENLSEQCKNCSVVEVCRGGFIAHRYSKDNGFKNPSIYCRDLEKLVTYVSEKIAVALT
jgi:uncharacterized protein